MDLVEMARQRFEKDSQWQQKDDARFCKQAISALAFMLFPDLDGQRGARSEFLASAEATRTARAVACVNAGGVRFCGRFQDAGDAWTWTARLPGKSDAPFSSLTELGAIANGATPPGWKQ